MIPFCIYNIILIFLTLIVQLDNFSLFYDLNTLYDSIKKEHKTIKEYTYMEQKYLKIISNQINCLSKSESNLKLLLYLDKKRQKQKLKRSISY